ncbi:MAG TPA: hypothetical protein VNN08_09130 [Thermoanaerobaculia bacterium]|nr:hypothetical protein [Thermoanaerobaculia bacterium]
MEVEISSNLMQVKKRNGGSCVTRPDPAPSAPNNHVARASVIAVPLTRHRSDATSNTAFLKHYHSSRRESFSPRGFLRGEKVPKADEGAVLALKLRVFMSFPPPIHVNSPLLGKIHAPHPPSAPSPPAEKRWGRRALDGVHGADDSSESVRNAAIDGMMAKASEISRQTAVLLL